MNDEVPVKRWTAKRKSAVVIDIFKGKITPVEVSRQHDLTVAEVERWVDEAERRMETGFRTRPRDVREQYGKGAAGDPRGARSTTNQRLGLRPPTQR